MNLINDTIRNQCYFLCYLNTTVMFQVGSIQHFSKAIDSGVFHYNLSAYFSCFSQYSFAFVRIAFYTEELISAVPRSGISKNNSF